MVTATPMALADKLLRGLPAQHKKYNRSDQGDDEDNHCDVGK